ncbi:carbohydrate ABC transporter permease [Microbacterium sp. NPDC019599]|uniref:carbohydrate ABC transporter permease n=1 Tax=Microbacterium sp. NPDC019599 TaxID=3154690 RepID=UPI0033D29987
MDGSDRRPASRVPDALKRRPRRRTGTRNWVGAVGAWAWLAVVIVPLYYVVISSLRPRAGYFASNQLVPPADPTLDGYSLVLSSGFLLYLSNSLVVTTVSVAVTVFICLLAAYAIVRVNSRFTRTAFRLFLLGLAVPLHATIVPLFYLLSAARLYDTLLAVILPSIGFAVPITVLILANFIRDIPRELFESMRVDGAGDWRMLAILVTPLARPAIVTVIVYDALIVWNGFLFPLVMTQSAHNRVLPLSLWTFQGAFTVNVPAILAAVVLSTLPIFTLYLFGRRHIVTGMTAGFGR